MEPENEGHDTCFGKGIDDFPPEGVWEREGQDQEEDNLKDEKPEEEDVDGVDHDDIMIWNYYKQSSEIE